MAEMTLCRSPLFLSVIVLLATACSCSCSFVEVTKSGARSIDSSFVVQFAKSARAEFEHFKETRASMHNGFATIEFGDFMAFTATLNDAAELLEVQSMAGVMRIEPNIIGHIQGEQFGVEAQGIDRLDQRTGLNQIYRWRDDADGSGVEVHVHDTGIDTAHPEFGGRAQFLADCSLFPTPCDYQNDPGDGHSHGTHCAGTVGSKTYGIAKNVTLVAVKVCNNGGQCSMGSILAGYEVTANAPGGAQRIINFSITVAISDILNDAVDELHALGIVVVVAAGNFYSDSCYFSPCSADGAVVVAASTFLDEKSVFSNTGPCVDIWAPGTDVLSTLPGGGAGIKSGTSMATPHVAGVAALIASRGGHAWTSESIVAALYAEGTRDVIDLWNHTNTVNLLAFTSPDGGAKTLS